MNRSVVRGARSAAASALLAAAALGVACGIDLAGTGGGAPSPPGDASLVPTGTTTPTAPTSSAPADASAEADAEPPVPTDPDASVDAEAPLIDAGLDGADDGGAVAGWLLIPGRGAGAGTGWNTLWWSKDRCRSGDALFDEDEPEDELPDPQARSVEGELRWPRAGQRWARRDDAPQAGVARDFCARFQANLTLQAGSYKLSYVKDDGLRVYVDGVRVVDDWTMNALDDLVSKDATLGPYAAGPHEVVIFFRDTGGGAVLSMEMSGPY